MFKSSSVLMGCQFLIQYFDMTVDVTTYGLKISNCKSLMLLKSFLLLLQVSCYFQQH